MQHLSKSPGLQTVTCPWLHSTLGSTRCLGHRPRSPCLRYPLATCPTAAGAAFGGMCPPAGRATSFPPGIPDACCVRPGSAQPGVICLSRPHLLFLFMTWACQPRMRSRLSEHVCSTGFLPCHRLSSSCFFQTASFLPTLALLKSRRPAVPSSLSQAGPNPKPFEVQGKGLADFSGPRIRLMKPSHLHSALVHDRCCSATAAQWTSLGVAAQCGVGCGTNTASNCGVGGGTNSPQPFLWSGVCLVCWPTPGW